MEGHRGQKGNTEGRIPPWASLGEKGWVPSPRRRHPQGVPGAQVPAGFLTPVVQEELIQAVHPLPGQPADVFGWVRNKKAQLGHVVTHPRPVGGVLRGEKRGGPSASWGCTSHANGRRGGSELGGRTETPPGAGRGRPCEETTLSNGPD